MSGTHIGKEETNIVVGRAEQVRAKHGRQRVRCHLVLFLVVRHPIGAYQLLASIQEGSRIPIKMLHETLEQVEIARWKIVDDLSDVVQLRVKVDRVVCCEDNEQCVGSDVIAARTSSSQNLRIVRAWEHTTREHAEPRLDQITDCIDVRVVVDRPLSTVKSVFEVVDLRVGSGNTICVVCQDVA